MTKKRFLLVASMVLSFGARGIVRDPGEARVLFNPSRKSDNLRQPAIVAMEPTWSRPYVLGLTGFGRLVELPWPLDFV